MPDLPNPSLPLSRVKLLSLALLFLAISCGGGTTLRVFAASSLTGPFKDIAKAFEAQRPGVAVALDFGGSQRLRSQLEFGAKADVFASADTVQMEALVAAGLVSGTPVDFALNGLVIIAMPEGPVNEISDLARPGVRVVLAQRNVPVGSYSRQVLENLSKDRSLGLGGQFENRVLDNLVSEEPNVRTVAQKVTLGEVDAGIVYRTDTAQAGLAGNVLVISIPVVANVNAQYPIAVLEEGSEPELAQAFVRFVLSESGQRILNEYGFTSP